MKNEIHNRLKVFILRLVMGMSVASSVFADVTPVPNSVVPKKIEGVRPRNVVFILSDDHRYDAMSFMGHPFAKTPYMDAMAQEGAQRHDVDGQRYEWRREEERVEEIHVGCKTHEAQENNRKFCV